VGDQSRRVALTRTNTAGESDTAEECTVSGDLERRRNSYHRRTMWHSVVFCQSLWRSFKELIGRSCLWGFGRKEQATAKNEAAVIRNSHPLDQSGRRRRKARPLNEVLIALAAIQALAAQAQSGKPTINQIKSSPADGIYVGARVCGQCHKQIYDEFSRTAMGKSMTSVTPTTVAKLQLPDSLYVQNLDRHFEVYAKEGKLYQSEFQLDAGGREIFRDTRQVEWIIGSGANGFGGLVQRDNYLFQAPLSYYSKTGSWALSPGYEFGDYGFSRPILAGCIVCHSGRPNPVANSNGEFEATPFTELSVGCEKCHGPGGAHVRAMQGGDKGKETHIVNPARLTPELANNICMSCHQTGDLRVLQPGKTFQDFRPGSQLDETLAILMVPPESESPPQADHLEHYYSMTLSKCYRSSGGRMSCITCHDPHVEPSAETAPAYFNGRCMTCHSEKSCSLAITTRQTSSPPDNCIGCHMPKRDVRVISHSTITNHRILARPDEPFPELAFHQTTASLPDLIHLNARAGSADAPIPLLTLLQAYGELSENNPDYLPRYIAVLGELEQKEPDNVLVQSALGRRDLRAGKPQQALEHLQFALKIGPAQATIYADLSEALVKLDRPAEAIRPLETAIELDPFNPVLQKTLVVRLIQLKQYPKAQATMEKYVDNFPQDSFLRQMLARAKAEAPAQ
jgi:hypothetical protein